MEPTQPTAPAKPPTPREDSTDPWRATPRDPRHRPLLDPVNTPSARAAAEAIECGGRDLINEIENQ